MEPQRNTNATIVDLLDRVLDKGLIIHADIIVSVAGIPLIGVNLRAALAGMETMLKYGIMQSWDERTRVWEREHRGSKEISLGDGEEIILKMLGSYYSSEGIYTAWRYGYFYLTTQRLLLYHETFGKVLFEISLEKIGGLVIRKGEYFSPLENSARKHEDDNAQGKILTGFTEKKEREELYLLLGDNKVARLSALDVAQLKEAIEKRMNELGLALEMNSSQGLVVSE